MGMWNLEVMAVPEQRLGFLQGSRVTWWTRWPWCIVRGPQNVAAGFASTQLSQTLILSQTGTAQGL